MFFSNFLPKNDVFYELFNQHADFILKTAQGLKPLVDNYEDMEIRARYIS